MTKTRIQLAADMAARLLKKGWQFRAAVGEAAHSYSVEWWDIQTEMTQRHVRSAKAKAANARKQLPDMFNQKTNKKEAK
jgi:hypothetical protein